MNTHNQSKVIMTSAFTLLKAQHENILNRTYNYATYGRMARLLEKFREMCFEVSKFDETLATVYFEVADRMIAEAFEVVIDDSNMLEDLETLFTPDYGYEDYRINKHFEEPAYPSNDEFGDFEGFVYESEESVVKPTTIFKYNGKVLDAGDELPF